eukprot:GHVU01172461.1.p1 GENE.GHVU01172461.1~~GHVU01172461.1.p1  ORF type:complete len:307 (+),score=45.47 GHVU01172461.1:589-1509(+)
MSILLPQTTVHVTAKATLVSALETLLGDIDEAIANAALKPPPPPPPQTTNPAIAIQAADDAIQAANDAITQANAVLENFPKTDGEKDGNVDKLNTFLGQVADLRRGLDAAQAGLSSVDPNTTDVDDKLAEVKAKLTTLTETEAAATNYATDCGNLQFPDEAFATFKKVFNLFPASGKYDITTLAPYTNYFDGGDVSLAELKTAEQLRQHHVDEAINKLNGAADVLNPGDYTHQKIIGGVTDLKKGLTGLIPVLEKCKQEMADNKNIFPPREPPPPPQPMDTPPPPVDLDKARDQAVLLLHDPKVAL